VVLVAVLALAGAVVAHHDLSPDMPSMSVGMACLAVLATGIAAAIIVGEPLRIRADTVMVTAPRRPELGLGLAGWSARDGPLFVVVGVFRC
jgi:hypothetical protein